MTYGKLRQFRRDRVYASDKDRLQAFLDMIKKTRMSEDQLNHSQNYNYTGGNNHSSNTKGGQRGWSPDGHHHGKGGNSTKISPSKSSGAQGGGKYSDTHTNNGQVMTQISAIYAKRSRSILNQFGQTNIAHGPGNASNIN